MQLVLPTPVRRLILDGDCVAFIGSGASGDCYHNWHDFINHLGEACGTKVRVSAKSDEDELLDAAENAKRKSPQGYFHCIGDHFGKQPTTTNLLYQALLKLPFKTYMTINLDPLLAREAQREDSNCEKGPWGHPVLDFRQTASRTSHYLHGYPAFSIAAVQCAGRNRRDLPSNFIRELRRGSSIFVLIKKLCSRPSIRVDHCGKLPSA